MYAWSQAGKRTGASRLLLPCCAGLSLELSRLRTGMRDVQRACDEAGLDRLRYGRHSVSEGLRAGTIFDARCIWHRHAT